MSSPSPSSGRCRFGSSSSDSSKIRAAREVEVLGLVAKGSTNREIGRQLGISENTVNFHVKNILGKLHLKNRAQATAYAIREGIVDTEDGKSA